MTATRTPLGDFILFLQERVASITYTAWEVNETIYWAESLGRLNTAAALEQLSTPQSEAVIGLVRAIVLDISQDLDALDKSGA
jgi:hypothetical protein